MIVPIYWLQPARGEARSAFDRKEGKRPLRLTLHNASLRDLPEQEMEALNAIIDFAYLESVDVAQFDDGDLSRILVDTSNFDADHLQVAFFGDGFTSTTGIWQPARLIATARRLTNSNGEDTPESQLALDDLIAEEAHISLNRDILVTTSPLLLRSRSDGVARNSNARTPSEAAYILGLFLRSQDEYVFQPYYYLGRGTYYWLLAAHKLPSNWRYRSACYQADDVRRDGVRHLADGVYGRCIRALQARDAVGIEFYKAGDGTEHDSMEYHFTYLSLLLAGAFDAQARIAHRAYSIINPTEYSCNFRRTDFLNALAAVGAQNLHAIVSGQHYQDVTTLLYRLRNMIHGTAFPHVVVVERANPEVFFLSVPDQEDSRRIWEAAERLGAPASWGLIRSRDEVRVEPFTFAYAIVKECLALIDNIARNTDVTQLFPPGMIAPQFIEYPPADRELFSERNLLRASAIGG